MDYDRTDFARLCRGVRIDPEPDAYRDWLWSGVVWSLWAVWYRRGSRQHRDRRITDDRR